MARSDNLHQLPEDLPVPMDDGAARHLVGMTLPDLELPSTSGNPVNLSRLETRWTVIYCYPRTGLPGRNPTGGLTEWNAIPGARGCTPQSCAYRDQHAALARLGARVFGLSTQTTEYQREMVQRLHLSFDVLSDHELKCTKALRLPVFQFAGETMTKRCTLLIAKNRIEECFYPVFPPDGDAEKTLEWLKGRDAR
ncbi:MAG: peroxiredoxin [Elusimicrobia bacterium]|nr:peroxiredoxin [Elusimicrobiota bacterium]